MQVYAKRCFLKATEKNRTQAFLHKHFSDFGWRRSTAGLWAWYLLLAGSRRTLLRKARCTQWLEMEHQALERDGHSAAELSQHRLCKQLHTQHILEFLTNVCDSNNQNSLYRKKMKRTPYCCALCGNCRPHQISVANCTEVLNSPCKTFKVRHALNCYSCGVYVTTCILLRNQYVRQTVKLFLPTGMHNALRGTRFT